MSPDLQIEALMEKLEAADFWERISLQSTITELQKQIEQAKEAEAQAKAAGQEKGAQQDKGAETGAERAARLEAGKATDQERQSEPEKAKEASREQDKAKASEADQERDQGRENSIEGTDNELSVVRTRTEAEGGKIDMGHRVLERTLGGNEGVVFDHEMTVEEHKAEADLQAEWRVVMEKQRVAELATHDPAERQQHQSPFADVADRNRAEAEAADKEPPRELEAGERVSGEVVGEYQDDNGRSHYEIETSDGERVGVPKDPDGPELGKGDDVTAERDERGNYDVQDYSYGR